MLELHGVRNDSEQAVTCRAFVWQHCSLRVQLSRVRARVQRHARRVAAVVPSRRVRLASCRSAAPSPKTSRRCRGMTKSPPAFSKIKLGGVGPCSGYPVCGGPPLPNCLVSLCVAMIAITLLATQGHGFRCVSSLHQVSLAFGQPRVASPSRAQPPPASACVRSLRAPRLAVWVPAPASLSA